MTKVDIGPGESIYHMMCEHVLLLSSLILWIEGKVLLALKGASFFKFYSPISWNIARDFCRFDLQDWLSTSTNRLVSLIKRSTNGLINAVFIVCGSRTLRAIEEQNALDKSVFLIFTFKPFISYLLNNICLLFWNRKNQGRERIKRISLPLFCVLRL